MMWLAKDFDGTIVSYENMPIYDNGNWYVKSGWYFDLPNDLVYELLGKNLKIDETIAVEFRKI